MVNDMSQKPEYHITIKEMPEDQRPRERLIRLGSSSLSSAEILAIILRTGTDKETSLELAQKVLAQNGGLHYLAEASVEELGKIRGIGPAKGAQIKAAIELGRRLVASEAVDRPTIKSPDDVVNLVAEEMRYLDREHFKTVLLNTKNHVLELYLVSVGSLNASLVHPRELFKRAVVKSAAGIILVHNHPSGDPEPSAEDKEITMRIIEAGEIIGIDVLDHIVIGDGKYVSLRQRGLMGE